MDNNERNKRHDLITHHLLELREPPDVLVAFRTELMKPQHQDIVRAAMKEPTFEGVLATVAEKLDIVLDGIYDPIQLLSLLTNALKKRGLFVLHPHLRDERLQSASIVETEGEITLEEAKEEPEQDDLPGIIIPDENGMLPQ